MTDSEKIKLIVSDLDGTLLNRESLLSEANKEAVYALHEKGIAFTFATGRIDKMSWHYAEALRLKLPIIGSNGAVLRRCGETDCLWQQPLTEEVIERIRALCDKASADHLYYGKDTVYYSPGSRRIRFFEEYNALADSSGQEKLILSPLSDFPDGLPEKISKVFVVMPEDPGKSSALDQALQNLEGCDCVVSVSGTRDLIPPGSSKGKAAAKLAESLGIPMEEVCCLGDQANDISMLEQAGLAIGMRSGDPAIRPYCDCFAEHYNCDGFARAVRQLFLRR